MIPVQVRGLIELLSKGQIIHAEIDITMSFIDV